MNLAAGDRLWLNDKPRREVDRTKTKAKHHWPPRKMGFLLRSSPRRIPVPNSNRLYLTDALMIQGSPPPFCQGPSYRCHAVSQTSSSPHCNYILCGSSSIWESKSSPLLPLSCFSRVWIWLSRSFDSSQAPQMEKATTFQRSHALLKVVRLRDNGFCYLPLTGGGGEATPILNNLGLSFIVDKGSFFSHAHFIRTDENHVSSCHLLLLVAPLSVARMAQIHLSKNGEWWVPRTLPKTNRRTSVTPPTVIVVAVQLKHARRIGANVAASLSRIDPWHSTFVKGPILISIANRRIGTRRRRIGASITNALLLPERIVHERLQCGARVSVYDVETHRQGIIQP